MIKRLVAAVVGVAAALTVAAVPAQADAPIVVNNGMRIAVGYPNHIGHCTLGPVGYDDAGRKIGITAAHCLDLPAEKLDVNLDEGIMVSEAEQGETEYTEIGELRFVSSDRTRNDFMVIEFNDNVVLSANGPGIRVNGIATGPLSWLTKDGQTTGVTSGPIISKTNGVFDTWVPAFFGDSGGPVVGFGTTKWAGIISRAEVANAPVKIISASNILGYMLSHNAIGAGFEPVNN